MEKNDAFLKKLLETFKVEAAEHISAISSGLIELEMSPSAQKQGEIIESVFREAHSMKGAARAVNLTVVENLCQHLESVLSALKRKDIVPAGELLDLLHRSVNELEGLLAEGAPFSRAGIPGLIHELDIAVKGIFSEEKTKVPSPASRQTPPPPETAPPIRRSTTETMRISKQRLDSILLQAEGLLSVKQLVDQRSAELRRVLSEIAALRKEWETIRPEMRKAANVTKKAVGPVRRLSDFLDAKGERVEGLYHALAAITRAAERDGRTIAPLVDNLLEDLKTVAMLPFSSLLEMLPKVVRDLSHDRGKEVSLTTGGEEIEIDRRILDEMKEPLIHLIRNCIDHGIEKPEQRIAIKKTTAGRISIKALHREGKSVEISVSDDGTGVDITKIRNSAVRLGILSREEADRTEDAKLLPFIFRSGVTTSRMITDLSGRGLGLAIVQEKVERLGGSVACETFDGKGTSFRIILPMTLAAFRGVLVEAEGRRFVIPITGIDRTLKTDGDEIRTVENRETIKIGDRTIPFVPLRAALEMPRREKGSTPAGSLQAAVLGAGEDRIAFGVDEILHEQEVLVKDLGRQLARVRNVSGATVLGTGEVVPVLNVSDLLKSAVGISPVREVPSVVEEKIAGGKSVLVVEDSITARTLLKNILEAAGYDVQTAVDGVDAFATLKTGRFDIVVSDIDMPRMNGLDLTAKIRSDKKLADIPVVLVTALESREDRERGIDVGANAYIVKSSFDQSNLLEVIRRMI